MLAALDGEHALGLALGALELQHNLLGGLGLLTEHGLSLSSETCLFPVVTSLTLCYQRSLASLVLSHLLRSVLVAALAVRVATLRDHNHLCKLMKENKL